MITNHSRFSRRAFVKATGIGMGFLPLLAADRPTWGQANTPKRLIMFTWPNGVSAGHWWPDAKKGPYDYTFSTAVSPTDFTFKGMNMIEPLEPHRSGVILFLNQTLGNIEGAGHESLPLLYDVGGGNSLDSHVSAKIGTGTKFRTLNLAVEKKDRRGHIFRDGQGVTLEGDPFKLFDSLFASGGLDPKVFDKQRTARTSVLDYVGKQLEGFGKTLGTDDRQRVEFHLTNLREVEKRLSSATTAPPTGRPASLPTNKFDVGDTNNFHLVTRAQIDLILMALASDLTRVVTLLMSDGDASGLILTWLGPNFAPASTSGGLGNDNSHHSISHSGRQSDYETMQRWFVQQQADLIDRLKNTTDPTGASLFKSSLVYSTNNMSTGGGHGTTNMPCYVASGMPEVKGGRYLKNGAPVKALLGSIASVFGAPLGGAVHPTFAG